MAATKVVPQIMDGTGGADLEDAEISPLSTTKIDPLEENGSGGNRLGLTHKDSVAISRDHFHLPEAHQDQISTTKLSHVRTVCMNAILCMCGDIDEDDIPDPEVVQQPQLSQNVHFNVENFYMLPKEEQVRLVNSSWREVYDPKEPPAVVEGQDIEAGLDENVHKEEIDPLKLPNTSYAKNVRIMSQKVVIAQDRSRVLSFSDDKGKPLNDYKLIPNRDATWKGWFAKRRGYFILLFFVSTISAIILAFIFVGQGDSDDDDRRTTSSSWET